MTERIKFWTKLIFTKEQVNLILPKNFSRKLRSWRIRVKWTRSLSNWKEMFFFQRTSTLKPSNVMKFWLSFMKFVTKSNASSMRPTLIKWPNAIEISAITMMLWIFTKNVWRYTKKSMVLKAKTVKEFIMTWEWLITIKEITIKD